MKVSELARSAHLEITSNKARSSLTCFSLAIGVAAIIFTFSQVEGMKKRYIEIMELSGPGRIKVQKRPGYTSRGLSKGLTLDDARAIRRIFPELYMVSPVARTWGSEFQLDDFHSDSMRVLGVTEEWRKRDWVYVLKGRFITAQDVEDTARVCLLVKPGGWTEKPFWAKYFPEKPIEKIFKHKEVLGKKVRMKGHIFTVIGVLEEPDKDKDPRWSREGGGDGKIVIPITTLQTYLKRSSDGANRPLRSIEIDTGDGDTAANYIRQIKTLLKSRHRGEEDFEIKDFRELIAGAMERMKEFATAILVIGIVAVLAGGIGIMNVTLATIFSRIREIGIRRALGATRMDIIQQFVTEAVALGVIGGIAGSGLGIAAVKFLAPDADRMAAVGIHHLLAALVIAMGTGFFFSIFPAYQASKFDPIEALHYE